MLGVQTAGDLDLLMTFKVIDRKLVENGQMVFDRAILPTELQEDVVPVSIGNASVCLSSVLGVRCDKTVTDRAIFRMSNI